MIRPIRGLLSIVGRILRGAWIAVWVSVYCVGVLVCEVAAAMGGNPLEQHIEESERLL